MSAEEFDKPKAIPEGLEKALARLAKKTVENNWDPVRVLTALMRGIEWWNSLTPEQRLAIQRALREGRYPRVGAKHKPRSA